MPSIKDQEQEFLVEVGKSWFRARAWEAFPFQIDMMEKFLQGFNGVLNAPTGSGKTYAVWIPILLDWIKRHPTTYQTRKSNGLQAIWITPLRALAKDIVRANQLACEEMEIPWEVQYRTGDTPSSTKNQQIRSMPEGLVTTPESMHVLFANKQHKRIFKDVKTIVIDEWHELLGTKRGVQVELCIAKLRKLNPEIKIWGISATIGNMEEAIQTLLGSDFHHRPYTLVKSTIPKNIEVESVLPDEIEKFPWAGHLGTNMIYKVLPIIADSQTSLLFTNTRSQAEIWYRGLLEEAPELAGVIAMHHGSISAELRTWIEDALHEGKLKVVVCTSSLDLGVDFRPVDTVIQVGGPKGVARFIQRAGRSGHRPGAISKMHFVPTHSLELVEAAAIRQAVAEKKIESRIPILKPIDVLIQYALVNAVATGFYPSELYEEITQTHAFKDLSIEEFNWVMDFITTGGQSLAAYNEYKKVEIEEDGQFIITDRKIARQVRLSIGTIVGDATLTVKFMGGKRIGTVEEAFISQVKPGDTFWFGGRSLELIRIRNMEAIVKKSKKKTGVVPRWMGSRMPLSSEMSQYLRHKIDGYVHGDITDIEVETISPMLDLQARWSAIPEQDECLIEYIVSREGYHLFIYPFEGRVIHEFLSALTAWRISQMTPLTFSIAMNDYGFELLSDKEIPIEEALENKLFSADELTEHITHSINRTEMARRRFREISAVGGLVFQGYPGKQVPFRHLQASTNLLFKVFKEYDTENLLLKQAYREVIDYHIDGRRLNQAMQRLSQQNVVLRYPKKFTPFCFPIMVDRLREKLTSEKLVDRIARMQVQLERQAELES